MSRTKLPARGLIYHRLFSTRPCRVTRLRRVCSNQATYECARRSDRWPECWGLPGRRRKSRKCCTKQGGRRHAPTFTARRKKSACTVYCRSDNQDVALLRSHKSAEKSREVKMNFQFLPKLWKAHSGQIHFP